MDKPRSVAHEQTSAELVIEREFEAPRELVFRMWTDPAHFRHWFGPPGTTMDFCELDPRPGGGLNFRYRLACGTEYRIKGVFREVDEPRRIVFTESFTDAAGNLIERPGFPLVARITVTFDEDRGKTLVVVRHSGAAHSTRRGWNQSLERLQVYVQDPREDRLH